MEPDNMMAHADLGCQASHIGNAFRRFGAALANPSWKFEVKDDEIIGRVAIPEVQDVKPIVLPLAYLDKDTVIRLLRDIGKTGPK